MGVEKTEVYINTYQGAAPGQVIYTFLGVK